MHYKFVFRVRILVGLVILIGLVLIVRLYMLQVMQGEAYREEALGQYVRTSQDMFDRGGIYFTEKDGKQIAAASVKSGFVLAINPNKITNPEDTYRKISPYIDIDQEYFMARAGRIDDPYEEVAHHVGEDTVNAIDELDIPGVQFFREQWRYYTGNSLAAHVLGFVGQNENKLGLTGQYGIERYWESVLVREDDQLYVNFFAEIFSNVQGALDKDKVERKGDIVTSIEPSVQQALETVLLDIENEWHANEIAGIIINPKNGDVYALAARPTYDPNNYSDAENLKNFGNPLVENVYEMGSIIKPLAMAIGLDTGAITADTTYDDTGTKKFDTFTIGNYDGRARGIVDMQEVLNQSLNLGMAFVARQIGNEVFGERMRKYGIGEETGIDLPHEVRGLVDNLNSPRDIEYATAAFGQGIALTPIETVRALCSLGNGGYLVTPHVVQSIEYEHGGEGNVSLDDRVQVLKPETSEEITRMLVEVVDTALRDGTVKKEHYSIAAKTGTAQIAKTDERGYYDDRYLHSFFGYFPAYEPEFLIFLYHTEPKGARYASETLTKPFMELVDFLINYYEIPPDR